MRAPAAPAGLDRHPGLAGLDRHPGLAGLDRHPGLAGLDRLHADTHGTAEVCVAVVDGPVDLAHPCFAGADVRVLDTLVTEGAGDGPMARHGTQVASLLFGRPGGPVGGLAPGCRGLIVPVFADDGRRLSQLDLARAIEQAVEAGAQVVNVSGGERMPAGRGDEILARALRLCAERGVLVVAAAGNDGCACTQVPAGEPSVLAVGALGTGGRPLEVSNWGEEYRDHGILAPGEAIEGATPGGGTAPFSGSSAASPLVAGVAALLLSRQAQLGRPLDPLGVGRALVASAAPCPAGPGTDCRRYLAGTLDVAAAHRSIDQTPETTMTITASPTSTPTFADTVPATPHPGVGPASAEPPGSPPAPAPPAPEPQAYDPAAARHHHAPAPAPQVYAPVPPVPASTPPYVPSAPVAGGVAPSCSGGAPSGAGCSCGAAPAPASVPLTVPATVAAPPSLVYAIGTVGYDFQTEARRDGFRQQMSPAYPYDRRELSAYLATNPWASNKVTWTLMLDRTPVYALESEVPVGLAWGGTTAGRGGTENVDAAFPPVSFVHKVLREAIAGQVLADSDPNFVSRVSIPGVMTGRTTRLFSGQVVPVVTVQAEGMHTWNEPALVNAVVDQVKADREDKTLPPINEAHVRQTVRAFLDKVYYQFRNLGQTAPDRALNFAGTNAFLLTEELSKGLLSGQLVPGANDGLFSLSSIDVRKSPYERLGSDSWDVVVSFFDPSNNQVAKRIYQFTIDVSDVLPVSLSPVHQFLA